MGLKQRTDFFSMEIYAGSFVALSKFLVCLAALEVTCRMVIVWKGICEFYQVMITISS